MANQPAKPKKERKQALARLREPRLAQAGAFIGAVAGDRVQVLAKYTDIDNNWTMRDSQFDRGLTCSI